MQTHEAFIHAVVGFAKARLNADERRLIDDAKIVYGAGNAETRKRASLASPAAPLKTYFTMKGVFQKTLRSAGSR